MKFSTKGNKLGIINRNTQHIQIFDFDVSTGIFSNEKTITGITHNEYGLEFDRTGRYLYYSRYNGTTSGSEIFQYDILATNITSTQTLIGTTTDYTVGSLQIAPDGKIYLARKEKLYLGVINNPSIQGVSCDFVSDGFYLSGKQSMFGLPSQILIDINNHTLVDTTICEGDSIFLQNSYQNSNGTYIDTLTNIQGNDSIVETELTIDISDISLGNDTSICNGQSLVLNAGNFNSYIWNTGEITDTIQITQSGIYSVTVSNTNGCNLVDTIQVALDSIDIFLGNDTLICNGDVINLNAGNFETYEWNTGETTQSITVNSTGLYSVEVTNSNGCIGSSSIIVFVDDCLSVKNPKSDNYQIYPNPTTGFVSVRIEGDFKIEIINKLGEVVFSTNKNSFNLSSLPFGVYLAKITTKDNVGIEKIILKK